jgi:hypothetical protein
MVNQPGKRVSQGGSPFRLYQQQVKQIPHIACLNAVLIL